mmetsp:Transcript_24451/g.74625  ORF Transcript_24451/g.74625 Transcript_24451/m.74625 type:complete len:209 (+) Transcript_24451:280-906(+)
MAAARPPRSHRQALAPRARARSSFAGEPMQDQPTRKFRQGPREHPGGVRTTRLARARRWAEEPLEARASSRAGDLFARRRPSRAHGRALAARRTERGSAIPHSLLAASRISPPLVDPRSPNRMACLRFSRPNSRATHSWICSGYGTVENSPTSPCSHCFRITLYADTCATSCRRSGSMVSPSRRSALAMMSSAALTLRGISTSLTHRR